MQKQDARNLSPSAQEALRLRVVRAIHEGMYQVDAAQVFGVSRQSASNWYRLWREKGDGVLKSRRRGRPSKIRLAPWQAATTVRIITDRYPEQMKLPFALWTREAVQSLILRRFGIKLSVWTVGRYLTRWGFTPQKPLKRAYERDPQAVQHWIEMEYPAIRKQAAAEKARIYWGDEMGLRSDHQTGTSYGRKGQTPAIHGTGKRFRINMISAITNRGKLNFMVFQKNFVVDTFIVFLKRLIRQSDRKVFLIVDRHPVHVSKRIRNWINDHQDKIQLFYLPGYSPDLNPDELLNQDVKSNAVGRKRPRDKKEMLTGVRSYLRSTQRRPGKVVKYFQHPAVNYAA